MSGPVVWMAALFIPPLCLFSLCIATYALKISKGEPVKEGATKQFEDVTMEKVFKEPKCSITLCALVGSTVLNLDLGLPPYNGTPFEWPTLLVLFIAGLMSGNMSVKILKFMKGKESMSRGWVGVSLLIPLISVGLLQLRCIENLSDSEERIVRSYWICISALFTLLGGYLAVRDNSGYPKFPLLINPLEEPITRTKRFVICAVSLVIIYLGSLYSFLWISSIWETSSRTECGVVLALGILLVSTFLYAFLAFCHIVLIRLGWFGCCWWEAFFCLAVPCGLCTLALDRINSTTTTMIDIIILMVKIGTLGPLALFTYYPLLFKMQALLSDAGASGSHVVSAEVMIE